MSDIIQDYAAINNVTRFLQAPHQISSKSVVWTDRQIYFCNYNISMDLTQTSCYVSMTSVCKVYVPWYPISALNCSNMNMLLFTESLK